MLIEVKISDGSAASLALLILDLLKAFGMPLSLIDCRTAANPDCDT